MFACVTFLLMRNLGPVSGVMADQVGHDVRWMRGMRGMRFFAGAQNDNCRIIGGNLLALSPHLIRN